MNHFLLSLTLICTFATVDASMQLSMYVTDATDVFSFLSFVTEWFIYRVQQNNGSLLLFNS